MLHSFGNSPSVKKGNQNACSSWKNNLETGYPASLTWQKCKLRSAFLTRKLGLSEEHMNASLPTTMWTFLIFMQPCVSWLGWGSPVRWKSGPRVPTERLQISGRSCEKGSQYRPARRRGDQHSSWHQRRPVRKTASRVRTQLHLFFLKSYFLCYSSEAFKQGGRRGAKKVMIVITDGESHDSADLPQAIEDSEKDGITRYAIAVSLLNIFSPGFKVTPRLSFNLHSWRLINNPVQH